MPTIDPLIPLPVAIVIFSGVFIFILRSYLKVEKAADDRRTLLFLRLLSILVLLIVTLRPRIEFTEEKIQKDRVYFLFDRSSSMTIRDMPGRKNREDFMDSTVYKSRQHINKLKDKFDLKQYSFATELEKNPDKVKLDNNTALGSALYKTAIDSKIRKVKGVVLFSDGINTGGGSINRAVSELKRRNIPVYTMTVGQYKYQGNIVDGVISELECPQSVKKGKELEVNVKAIARGLKLFPTKIEIHIDDKLVKTLEINPENEETHILEKVKLNIEDFDAGYRKLSANIITGDREISPANNQLDTYFQIKEGGLKVLLLTTSPSPDFKFVSRILNKMEDLSVTIPNPFMCRTEDGKKKLNELKVQEFDVILLMNPDLNLLPLEVIQKCEAFMKVRKQGLMISGEMFLKSLREKKLLEEYLPAQIDKLDFDRKSGPAVLTKAAEKHFITQFFGEDKDLKFPEMTGRVSTLKPSLSAKTLIEHDKSPILVVDQFQRCRVSWINSDGLWQWMTDPTFKQNYQQLWKRMIYFLAHREADLSASLAVFTSKTRFKSGDNFTVNADLIDEKGLPVANADITMKVKMEKEGAEEAKSIFSFSRGIYNNELILNNGGLYTISAETKYKDEVLKSNNIKVFIQEPRTEFERILADKELMTKVAEVTGGRTVTPAELPELLEELQEDSKVRSVRTVTAKKDAWDNLFTYLAAALFLSIEWFKRRKIGLA